MLAIGKRTAGISEHGVRTIRLSSAGSGLCRACLGKANKSDVGAEGQHMRASAGAVPWGATMTSQITIGK
jgi:hypothetical protein